jgi:hypothetical protein
MIKVSILTNFILAYISAWAGLHFTSEEVKAFALAIATVVVREGFKYAIDYFKNARSKANHPDNKA